MTQTIVVSAFSVNMLPRLTVSVEFKPIGLEDARELLKQEKEPESAVGHPDTAAVFTELLGKQVLCNRISIKMRQGTRLLLGQYSGPRLPEGARELPKGATLDWWLVTAE